MPLFRPCQVVTPSVMTVDEARANILEAMELHLECMLEDEETIPVDAHRC
jgi:predicted RNase H-like HicB family nuclease